MMFHKTHTTNLPLSRSIKMKYPSLSRKELSAVPLALPCNLMMCGWLRDASTAVSCTRSSTPMRNCSALLRICGRRHFIATGILRVRRSPAAAAGPCRESVPMQMEPRSVRCPWRRSRCRGRGGAGAGRSPGGRGPRRGAGRKSCCAAAPFIGLRGCACRCKIG